MYILNTVILFLQNDLKLLLLTFNCLHILTVFCSALNTIENGNLTYTTSLTEEGYKFDTLAELNCHVGYKLSASSTVSRRCEGLGDWNGQQQTCIQGNKNISF